MCASWSRPPLAYYVRILNTFKEVLSHIVRKQYRLDVWNVPFRALGKQPHPQARDHHGYGQRSRWQHGRMRRAWVRATALAGPVGGAQRDVLPQLRLEASAYEFPYLVRAQGQLPYVHSQGIGHGVRQSGACGDDADLARALDSQRITWGRR